MRYDILMSKSSRDLESEVEEYLKRGFKCQGGVCVTWDAGATGFYQAMIKETEEETK